MRGRRKSPIWAIGAPFLTSLLSLVALSHEPEQRIDISRHNPERVSWLPWLARPPLHAIRLANFHSAEKHFCKLGEWGILSNSVVVAKHNHFAHAGHALERAKFR